MEELLLKLNRKLDALTAQENVESALVPAGVREAPPDPPKRMIYFVGDLIGDDKSGGMTMEQLVRTVSEVYQMSYGTSPPDISKHLQFHKEAQLLIFTGTIEQVNFIQATISASALVSPPSEIPASSCGRKCEISEARWSATLR